MTDEQANELLRNNDWAKVSDARDLLQHAAHLGYCEAANELTRLRAEVEALRADAERYRWLRQQSWYDSPICAVQDPREAVRPGFVTPFGSTLDYLIDKELGK